jgi:hypothetical protein
VLAELPHRVANDLFERCTGVALSSRGALGLIDSTAHDLQPWQAERGTQEVVAVVDALGAGDGAADLGVEIAMDGVMAPIDGRWQEALDYYHLSEHLYAFANLQSPNDPAEAKAWVDQKLRALLMDRVGDVLSALKGLRPWKQAVRTALAQLIGDIERNRTRIRYQEPWQCGLAVGSGAVEGACKHVIQSRFKRAGMRWKPPGFLSVLALRIARLNGTFQAFWASRGLLFQASA